jgi:hypothetical protein
MGNEFDEYTMMFFTFFAAVLSDLCGEKLLTAKCAKKSRKER